VANEFGATPDDDTIDTDAIQQAIDAAARVEGGGVVRLKPGLYRSGAVFVKSNVRLHLDEGVVIQAVQEDALYPERPTRVAGIEMVWPSALVNVYQQTNVIISGAGVIDGNGEYWWHKFWGEDGNSGMLGSYRERGLRWAVDYDCKRVRALAVYDSRDVEIRDVTIKRSGFWSLTLTYSSDILVDGVIIRANIGGYGPSSDGVDIDSSHHILVQNCDIDCNDDNICLKAGRDADGLRVNRPTEHVTIRNCITRSGHGMLTLGSETSGGIRHVTVENLRAIGTANGVRIKSARVRGGVIEDIRIRHLDMAAVDRPIHFELNWYPSYSYPTLPDDIDPEGIPEHWKVLTQRVEPPAQGIPEVRDIVISEVTATGAARALYANAYPEKPIHDIRLENVVIDAKEAGQLENARDWTMKNVTLRLVDETPLELEGCTNVALPQVVSLSTEAFEEGRKQSLEADEAATRLGLGGGAQDH
jgi:polygalacturonase